MPKRRFLEAGRIVGTHGVRGEARLEPWCDSPQVLTPVHTLYWDNGAVPVGVACRPHKQMVLVKLDGVDTVEAAEALRGRILYVDRGDLKLPEGRYFIDDLIGAAVVNDDTGEVYGNCVEVSFTGSNANYHLRRPDGSVVLIPAIPDVIRKVDPDGGEIRIFPMLGLFD